MNELAAQLPELALPSEIFCRDIRESLPTGLAKTIASHAVYLDVSTFKNDRKRMEMLQQLLELLYAIWKIQPQRNTKARTQKVRSLSRFLLLNTWMRNR